MTAPTDNAPQMIGADAIPRYDAKSLIADGVKAEIDLNGQIYTLRITRAGKLILTK
ncbi:hemin uptake protein HemP [Sagittula sp. SSi028]|uniref:hemin uptake protein HemP n=1 Tax=Sagittula sp. SSi028 TaxID=3400636 RepID=UPI003AF8C389